MTMTKRNRFAARTSVQDNISAIVDPSRELAVGVELIPISRVMPDPRNTRHIPLDFNDPARIDPADPLAAEKQAFLENLQGLARSIEEVGLINPVQVFRRGHEYVLVTGHRRLLAHKLIGRESVLASIHRAPRVRQSQFVENFQREDINMRERLQSIRLMLEEAGVDAPSKKQVVDVLTAGGVGQSQAYRWASVLLGPQLLHDAIAAGRVTNWRQASELAELAPAELVAALEQLADQGEYVPPAAPPPPPPAPELRRTKGRPRTNVALGKVRNPAVVRHIVAKVLGEDAFPGLDWSDMGAVTKAFQQMIKKLEKQL